MLPETVASTWTYPTLNNKLYSEVIVSNGDANDRFRALWDTGATMSCISHEVVRALGLTPTGKTPIHTPSGTGLSNTYLVNIQLLPSNVLLRGVQVCDSEIGGQSLGVLLGMNIICQGDFAVSNYKGQTVFTFRIPSVKRTDYVKEINLQKAIGTHGPGKRKKHKGK